MRPEGGEADTHFAFCPVHFVPRPFDPNSPLTMRSARKRERQAIVDDPEGQRPPKLVYALPSIPRSQPTQVHATAATAPGPSVPPTNDPETSASATSGGTTGQRNRDDTSSAPCAPATTNTNTTVASNKDAEGPPWNPNFCPCATPGLCVHILAVRIAQQLGRCDTPDPQVDLLMRLVDATTSAQPPPE